MQTITPVDVHVENDWHDNHKNKTTYVRKSATGQNPGGTSRQGPRMRTCVTNKIKTNRAKSFHGTQQVVPTKQAQPTRSRSPSPQNREPWVPPPGRSTKGQKFTWQSSKARLEITPVLEPLVHDDVDDEESLSSDLIKENIQNSTEQDEKLREEIQTYEKRIQGLIEGVGMLKERASHHRNQEQTDQLRADINSTLDNLEQSQQTLRNSRSPYRSSSVDEQRIYRSNPKVSFEDNSIVDRRRARSTTPVRGPLHLNPDREQLLISLSESEADIAQITKQLSSVKDILTKLKLEDQPVSFEIEQLNQQRNHLLHLIEQFERSNQKLKEFLHHQYHLEAEHGNLNESNETLLSRIHELENENQQIRRLLLERENDNIALQTEFERVRTHAIGFDTMKTSLEHNRAHLQRELYAKEGEINRLQCVLRSLERDLQRSRYQCDNIQRSIKRTPMFPLSSPAVVPKSKGLTIEKLQAQLNERDRQIDELERKLYGEKTEQLLDADSEITRLKNKLEHAERLVSEYKEQLHTQTLKTSVNNSKTYISEIELDKMRIRLQKRIEELEPLPELLRQAEMKNQELQTCILEQEKRLTEQAAYISELTSKTNSQNQLIERMKDNHYSFDDDHRVLQQKLDALQRQVFALEEENANLLRNLNTKEESLRNTQTRLNAKAHELATLTKQIDLTQTDLKVREDTFGSKERLFQQRISDLEQQITRLRQEYTHLKREKEECERRYASQLSELRDKLEQSNNNNRSMQNYVNSLKTTYATVFNDPLPPSFPSTTSFSRFSNATSNAYP